MSNPQQETAVKSQPWQNKLMKSIKHPLVPLKLALLFYDGGWALYLPYLTLQMVRTGLTISEVAIVYSALPFVTAIVPIAAGILADKFNWYKSMLVCFVLTAAGFHTALLHVDANHSFTEKTAEWTCGPTESVLRVNHSNCTDSPVGDIWPIVLDQSMCQSDVDGRMELCSVKGNCTGFRIPSSPLKLNVSVKDVSVAQDDQCVSPIRFVLLEEAVLICHAPVKCNVTLLEIDPSDDHRQRGFWIYFVIRIVATSCLCAASSLLETIGVRMVKKHQGDLGKQRIFGVIGQAIFGMLGGVLLDRIVLLKGYPDYAFLMYLADGLFLLVVLLVIRFDVIAERDSPRSKKCVSVTAGIGRIIRLIDVDIFAFVMLLLGTFWGFFESFLFVFLTDLGANSFLFGLTLTLGCVVGVPFLYVSDRLISKIGPANVIALAVLVYSIRFFGYAFIGNPWLCLPLEAMKSITIYLMAVASSTYCAAAAPTGLLATLNGFIGSIYVSFGRGLGTVLGGILMSTYGARRTFKIFGTVSAICGSAYFIFHRFYLVDLERIRLRRKSEHISKIMADGVQSEIEEEPESRFICPPDLASRRVSCY